MTEPTNSSFANSSAQGFLTALVDWRFRTFITPKIVSAIYLGSMALGFFTFILVLFSNFFLNFWWGAATLVLGPLALIIWLGFIRMSLELYVAVVRTSEDVHHAFGPDARR